MIKDLHEDNHHFRNSNNDFLLLSFSKKACPTRKGKVRSNDITIAKVIAEMLKISVDCMAWTNACRFLRRRNNNKRSPGDLEGYCKIGFI